MKTLIICHEGADLSRQGMARWLASFSDLVGIVVLHEGSSRLWRRVQRERKRIGTLRLLDVLAFRVWYRLFLAAEDHVWEAQKLAELCRTYPQIPETTQILHAKSPNSSEVVKFIETLAPDVIIARCKVLLSKKVFSLPTKGTFVMHPGICPEYRNSHGCFWALANDDLEKVGMTLLKIDDGVDTGPIFGYYSYQYDEVRETHVTIQNRVVYDNLDAIRDKLIDIYNGKAQPLDVIGRPSAVWGQPWLSRYLQWKIAARKRQRAT